MPEIAPGRPGPLGATLRDDGVNLAVWSSQATAVVWCVFDDAGTREIARHRLHRSGPDIWSGFLPGARAGMVYGLRVEGPWAPDQGKRFAPHKLLLDPWAREIVGNFEWRPEHFASDPRDNADWALKSRVVGEERAGGGTPLRHADADLLIYEMHVRGFTMRHPGVPAALRGTYAGLACDAAIAHLKRLGISAVCLLPVQQHLDEQRLQRLGLRNHWGYNTIGFFCPEPRYAAATPGAAVREEFRAMVARLHEAGIEVLLDVVYNHTAESDAAGPTLSWRGLDNAGWYRRQALHPGEYENLAGCGNTLDIRRPAVIRLVMDSLRHWVQAYGVDGFRFDLAPILGRGDHGFDRQAAFFQAVAQDPVLSGVRLIAEPWDLGHGGYRLGDFPVGWMEWNDRFRDTLRAYWLGHPADRAGFAQVLSGSANNFRQRGRTPSASINFVTSHDGFTLADLVTYTRRDNHANGENNQDGHSDNLASNCGHEGPSSDPAVLARRASLQRALLACTLLAQGTPMLAAGSEIGHSQRGNNNAYCQDNEISWLDWPAADAGLLQFTCDLIALRHELLPLGSEWHDGIDNGGGLHDLDWRKPDGSPLRHADWHASHERALAVLIGSPGRSATPLLLLVNADGKAVDFSLPAGVWRQRLDAQGRCDRALQATSRIDPRGVALLQLRR